MDNRSNKKEEEEKEKENKAIQNQNQRVGGLKGKSCKGCLYYSSTLKSKGYNPRCIGISRSLNQVPSYIVGQSEVEASKEGRSLVDFYYGCAGYSVYVSKDYSTNKQDTKTQLPVCVGLELLVDRKVSSAKTASVPALVHSREDGRELPQPQSQPQPQPRTPKPVPSTGDDFLSRYARNAGLVAGGG